MATSHVLSGLITKYAELAGELDELRKQVRDLKGSLAHIGSTIKIFDPNYPISQIKPKKKLKVIPGLKNGDTNKMTLEILRDSRKPLTVSDITAMLSEKLIVPLDENDRENLKKRVEGTIDRLQSQGTVKRIASIGPKSMALWELDRVG
ncbi:hypothetical protein RYZ26_17250 [Terasakiella sp. A23]|uniref:hypothetical protein n=1 Tax=Terasakiella sp. FCG-A23 TaxID=3080561 RepID=UPI002954C8D7|nr:hypothetical protein [Terasakiella sp. A23]MDV7341359.1 hypothetical protein [Terasakiella sp. A23]